MSSIRNTGIYADVDRLSKMTQFILFRPSLDVSEAALLFRNHVRRHPGLPRNIISERNPIFISCFWRCLFSKLGAKLSSSSAWHPQTEILSEILNCRVEGMTCSFVSFDESNWKEYLVDFKEAYCSSFNAATIFSPFYLGYRILSITISTQPLTSPSLAANDFLRFVRKATKEAQISIRKSSQSTAENVNKKRPPIEYKVGDLVYLSTKNIISEASSVSRKPHWIYCGPFEITRNLSSESHQLELSAALKTEKHKTKFM